MTLVSVPTNEAAVAAMLGPATTGYCSTQPAQVGDVTSNARGSGARYNAGKVPLDLLLLIDVADMLPRDTEERRDVIEALGALGTFQETRDREALEAVVACLYSSHTEALRDAARVLDYGRKKYAAWNWAKGMSWSIPLACAARHLLAIYDGERDDKESGLPHAAHVVCNVLMLAAFARFYGEGDDLPRVGGQAATVETSYQLTAQSRAAPAASIRAAVSSMTLVSQGLVDKSSAYRNPQSEGCGSTDAARALFR